MCVLTAVPIAFGLTVPARSYSSLLLVVLAAALLAAGCDRRVETARTERVERNQTTRPSTNLKLTGNSEPEIRRVSGTDPLGVDAMPRLEDSIVIGIDADMSSGSAHSGEAIRRGVVIAVNEINETGGLLGRPLEVVVRDHRGNPARGIDNVRELAALDRLIAIVGGIHTPVALEELDAIHENEVIYLGPWAAGTPLTSNGHDPNYVFRVSIRDEYAGEFLVDAAIDRGIEKIGLLLERTGWGRSNHTAMTRAMEVRGISPTTVEWFHWGEQRLDSQIKSLLDADSEAILLVCNPLEGVTTINAMASIPKDQRVPIISHWGITGGNLHELAAESLQQVDLVFLQTYSFIDPPRPIRAADVLSRYRDLFPGCESSRDVFAPAGTAHAYELVHMLAAAVRACGSTDRSRVRDALEELRSFEGLIRHYEQPFHPDLHDALTIEDFHLARFDDDGAIVLDGTPSGVGQP